MTPLISLFLTSSDISSGYMSVILFIGGVCVKEGVCVQVGVSVQRGLCPGSFCHGDPPGMVEERALYILLKCIFVLGIFLHLDPID